MSAPTVRGERPQRIDPNQGETQNGSTGVDPMRRWLWGVAIRSFDVDCAVKDEQPVGLFRYRAARPRRFRLHHYSPSPASIQLVRVRPGGKHHCGVVEPMPRPREWLGVPPLRPVPDPRPTLSRPLAAITIASTSWPCSRECVNAQQCPRIVVLCKIVSKPRLPAAMGLDRPCQPSARGMSPTCPQDSRTRGMKHAVP